MDLDGAAISTGGGDVMLWAGPGYTSGPGITGIGVIANSSISSGSGRISLIADQIASGVSGKLTLTSTVLLTLAPQSGSYGGPISFNGTTASPSGNFTSSGWSTALVINNLPGLGGLTLGQYTGTGKVGDTVYSGITNSSDVTMGGALSMAGPISLYGGNLALNANLASTASGAAILAKATGNITQAANVAVTSSAGAVTYWADADASGDGSVKLNAAASIATSGGNVVLNGGADLTTGYATYNALAFSADAIHNAGVYLDGASISAGAGSVTARGQSTGLGTPTRMARPCATAPRSPAASSP